MSHLIINEMLAAQLKARAQQEHKSVEELLAYWLQHPPSPHSDNSLPESATSLPLSLPQVFENGPVAGFITDIDGTILHFNTNAEKMFGYREAELVGQAIEVLIPDRLHDLHLVHRAKFLPTPHTHAMRGMDIVGLRSDGSEFPMEIALGWLESDNQRWYIGFMTDISERKYSEMVQRSSAALLRSLVESLPQNVFAKDLEGRFTFSNRRYLQTEGKELAQIIGITDFELHPPELAVKYREDDRRVIESRQLFEAIEEHQPIDGVRSYVHVIKAPLFNEWGEVTGLIGVFWDVTERKKAEEQMMAFALEKERVQMLADFLRNVSHEFRTPLSVIYVNSSLLETLTDPEQRKACLDRITEQADHLLKLVETLVQMSRLDGVTHISQSRLQVTELLHLVITRILPDAERQDIQLDINLPSNLPFVWGDAELLVQAFFNLLDNAVRYTGSGGRVSVEATLQDDRVIIAFQDGGPGISADVLPHIFEHFYREDKPHQTRGLGLGLPIAQKIIQGHGGTIDVKTAVGEGSIFRVILPTSPGRSPARGG